MIEDGKAGFLLTLMALLVMTGTFAAMALTGNTERLLPVTIASMITAAAGHFMLGGAEYRSKMLEVRKKRK